MTPTPREALLMNPYDETKADRASFLSGKELPILRIEIEWDGGSIVTDPNGLAIMSCVGDYPVGLPFKARPSMISGKPSYLYRADDFELPLTFGELDRFCRHALRKAEFIAMKSKIGIIHEIHDDFYDPNTGQSFQPRSAGSELSTTKARIGSLAEAELLQRAVKQPTARKSKNGL